MLDIRTSQVMSNPNAPMGKFENYLIRVNDYVRHIYDLKIGSYIKLLQRNGKELILMVQPNLPQDRENCGYVTEKTFNKINLLEQIERISKITIGCDPEFFIINEYGDLVRANSILKHRDKIGSDGYLGELRPDPSDNPTMVVNNLGNLIKELHNRLPTYDLLAKSAYVQNDRIYASGFHLHYGIPKSLRRKPYAIVRQILKSISKAMDYFIAIPCMIPERGTEAYRRLYTSYGQSTDFKFNNRITLEYRVPGGYYLRAPTLALGLLSLGVVVFGDILVKIEESIGFESVTNAKLRETIGELYDIPWDIRSILLRDDLETAKRWLPSIKCKIENMLGYEKYKSYIHKFFQCLEENKYSSNIALNWEVFSEDSIRERQQTSSQQRGCKVLAKSI